MGGNYVAPLGLCNFCHLGYCKDDEVQVQLKEDAINLYVKIKHFCFAIPLTKTLIKL